MTGIGRIQVTGLREFNRALKSMDAELPKRVRLVLNEAAEVVAGPARARMPRRSGAAIASLRVASTRGAVRIRLGGRKAPYAPWLDFGGRVGRARSVRRPFLRQGRYVWRSYADHRDQVIATMADGMARLARDAGLDVS